MRGSMIRSVAYLEMSETATWTAADKGVTLASDCGLR